MVTWERSFAEKVKLCHVQQGKRTLLKACERVWWVDEMRGASQGMAAHGERILKRVVTCLPSVLFISVEISVIPESPREIFQNQTLERLRPLPKVSPSLPQTG